MKDKHYSDTLQRILQGAKFCMKREYAKHYYYQITRYDYGLEVMKYYKNGNEYGLQGFVNEEETNGSTLVVEQPILSKKGFVEINADTEIEIIEE